jgi:single-stranded DNA-binding protein
MAYSDLSVNFTGRLGADPELVSTKSGDPMLSMRVAISLGKDRDGNERTAWVGVRAFKYIATSRGQEGFLRKGDLVAVTGTIAELEIFDGNNGPMVSTTVMADTLNKVALPPKGATQEAPTYSEPF